MRLSSDVLGSAHLQCLFAVRNWDERKRDGYSGWVVMRSFVLSEGQRIAKLSLGKLHYSVRKHLLSTVCPCKDMPGSNIFWFAGTGKCLACFARNQVFFFSPPPALTGCHSYVL